MKVLVLGARGMLGRDLVPLVSRKHEVSCKDIQDFDITDRQIALNQIGACRPDWVINAAAYTDVDGCESKAELAFAVNAEGARNVALGCARADCRLIHLSTDYVFDGESRTPYPIEGVSPNPRNVYGASKLQGERYVQESLEEHLILRTAWMYGKHGKNFVDTIVRLGKEKEELRVVNDQRGSPTFTRDLSEAILRLLEEKARGIVHVTNSGECTWFDFARRILELALPERKVRVIPISSKELARPAARPPYSVLDCSRYESITGLKIRHWEEALKEYLSAG